MKNKKIHKLAEVARSSYDADFISSFYDHEETFDLSPDKDGNTVLHNCMTADRFQKHYSILIHLLESKLLIDVDINAKNELGLTVLNLALEHNLPSAVILLQYGAEISLDIINKRSTDSNASLFDIVEEFMQNYDKELAKATYKEYYDTKLYYENLKSISASGHYLCRILHANPSSPIYDLEKASHHLKNSAIIDYNLGVLYSNPKSKIYNLDKALGHFDQSFNYSDKYGNTILHHLIMSSIEDKNTCSGLIYLLKSKRLTNINMKNKDGLTALDLAFKYNILAAIILIQYGATISLIDNSENNLLTTIELIEKKMTDANNYLIKIKNKPTSMWDHLRELKHKFADWTYFYTLPFPLTSEYFINFQEERITACHYVLGTLYNNPNSKIFDPDKAFKHFESCGEYLPAQKSILSFYIIAINEDEKTINPQAYALAEQTALAILKQEPDHHEAKAFIERNKHYPKSIQVNEQFNSIIGQPLKSLTFFSKLTRKMHLNLLFEAKSHGVNQHEFDKHFGLIVKPPQARH